MSPLATTSATPILFVRTPTLTQMRDPLNASWNLDLAEREAEGERNKKLDLAALVDFSQMNQTFADYLEVVGLPVAIIDPKGKVLGPHPNGSVCAWNFIGLMTVHSHGVLKVMCRFPSRCWKARDMRSIVVATD